MQTTIHTNRLSLSPLTIADHDFIFELLNTQGWIDFIGNRNINSKEDAIAYIKKINKSANLTYWLVNVTASNAPAGVISFMKREYLEHFDIGFAFLPRFQNNGYAYEATKEILSIVSRDSGHTQILATTVPGNIKSIKLLTKLGFHFDKEIMVEEEKLHVYSN
jgi:RimJ/RimL family protein N-acetyltransferase